MSGNDALKIVQHYRQTIENMTLKEMPDSVYTRGKIKLLKVLEETLDDDGPALAGKVAAIKEVSGLIDFFTEFQRGNKNEPDRRMPKLRKSQV